MFSPSIAPGARTFAVSFGVVAAKVEGMEQREESPASFSCQRLSGAGLERGKTMVAAAAFFSDGKLLSKVQSKTRVPVIAAADLKTTSVPVPRSCFFDTSRRDGELGGVTKQRMIPFQLLKRRPHSFCPFVFLFFLFAVVAAGVCAHFAGKKLRCGGCTVIPLLDSRRPDAKMPPMIIKETYRC